MNHDGCGCDEKVRSVHSQCKFEKLTESNDKTVDCLKAYYIRQPSLT